jgi:sugar lactone lactonase YvrE
VLGRVGTGPATLQEAKGMARDAAGRLYVVQSQANRITILNQDGSVAGTLGKAGTGDGEFQEPWSVAIAPDGSVYVADTWNHRIQKFDASGRFLTKWGTFIDTKGQRDGEPYAFWGPRDVAIGPDGNVYVSDTGNKRITIFDPNGRYLRALGGEGSGPGQLKEPVGIAFDPAGNLWVADTWNQRIQKLNPTTGQQLAQYPVPAWSSQAIADKPYLRSDPTGRIYATVPSDRRVMMVAPDGTLANNVAALQGYQFTKPIGVLAGPDGALWVSDSGAGVVVEVPGAPLPSAPAAVGGAAAASGGLDADRPTGEAAAAGESGTGETP